MMIVRAIIAQPYSANVSHGGTTDFHNMYFFHAIVRGPVSIDEVPGTVGLIVVIPKEHCVCNSLLVSQSVGTLHPTIIQLLSTTVIIFPIPGKAK